MAEYKRFIAYFYEYINGKKEKNAGFAKVELRNGMWRILFRLMTGEILQPPIRAYGFVRKQDELLGISMGTLQDGHAIAEEWAYHADSPVGEGDYRMEELAGIWIQSGDGRKFVTVWDDDPIQVDKFVPEEEEKTTDTDIEEEIQEKKETFPEEAQKELEMESMEIDGEEKAACSSLAEELLGKREKFQPFSGNEFDSCVKLQPYDISRMQQENWPVGRSSFLLHGYYQYKHLMLGRKRDGTYVLGVPGLQSRQEQYMAGMLGYEQFRAVRRCECGKMYGYWCRELQG